MTLEILLSRLFQSHPWHGIPPGDAADAVNAYVEIVPTDAVKYELDKASGHLRIDRPQRYSSQAPMPYGFVPRTWCGPRVGRRCTDRTGVPVSFGDRDPIDICVLTEKTFAQGNFLCRARPIGGLRIIDESGGSSPGARHDPASAGEADDKIVAVLEHDLAYGHLRELAEAPRGVVERLQHYFVTYKQLPGEGPRKVRIAEVYGREEAVETLRASEADYRDEYGAPEGRIEALRALLR